MGWRVAAFVTIRHVGKLNPEAKKTGVSFTFAGIFFPYFFDKSIFLEVEEAL
jgi:hypothetical protein